MAFRLQGKGGHRKDKAGVWRNCSPLHPQGRGSGSRAGQRSSIDALSHETTFGYDARDNLTTVTDARNNTTTYTYNGFDEKVTQVSPDTGTTTYTYDEAGNLATRTDARGITATSGYDALNRLASVTYPDASLNVTYSYDQGPNGKGRLTGMTDNTGAYGYTYDARGNRTRNSGTQY